MNSTTKDFRLLSPQFLYCRFEVASAQSSKKLEIAAINTQKLSCFGLKRLPRKSFGVGFGKCRAKTPVTWETNDCANRRNIRRPRQRFPDVRSGKCKNVREFFSASIFNTALQTRSYTGKTCGQIHFRR